MSSAGKHGAPLEAGGQRGPADGQPFRSCQHEQANCVQISPGAAKQTWRWWGERRLAADGSQSAISGRWASTGPGPARPCVPGSCLPSPAQRAAAPPAPPSADGARKSGELFSVLLRSSQSWMSFSELGTRFYLEHCFLLSTGGKWVLDP